MKLIRRPRLGIGHQLPQRRRGISRFHIHRRQIHKALLTRMKAGNTIPLWPPCLPACSESSSRREEALISLLFPRKFEAGYLGCYGEWRFSTGCYPQSAPEYLLTEPALRYAEETIDRWLLRDDWRFARFAGHAESFLILSAPHLVTGHRTLAVPLGAASVRSAQLPCGG